MVKGIRHGRSRKLRFCNASHNAVPHRVRVSKKSITATAAMVLWERGKLDLDSPVQTYCPQFPQKQWPITTRELLGHLGGIRYYNVPETPYYESESDPEVGNVHQLRQWRSKAV